MAEDQRSSSTISRRDVIQRGAVLGGLAWAAPSFSVLAPRALAQTSGTPFAGDVSWVMVWFVDMETDTLYRVKYESTDQGYSTQSGVTEQQMSSDDPNRFDYYAAQEEKLPTGLTFDTGQPPGVTAGSSNGALSITVSGSVQIYGWVLHDGSCQTNGAGFLRAAYANPGDVGPTVPTTGSGTFEWEKCT